jgi:hypothetical protein
MLVVRVTENFRAVQSSYYSSCPCLSTQFLTIVRTFKNCKSFLLYLVWNLLLLTIPLPDWLHMPEWACLQGASLAQKLCPTSFPRSGTLPPSPPAETDPGGRGTLGAPQTTSPYNGISKLQIWFEISKTHILWVCSTMMLHRQRTI